jgi:hypothetical protein
VCVGVRAVIVHRARVVRGLDLEGDGFSGLYVFVCVCVRARSENLITLAKSHQTVSASALGGMVHVRVFRIMNFKPDPYVKLQYPYVKLQYGTAMHKTATKNNTGDNAVFTEMCSFVRNPSQNQLQVAIYDSDDSDTLSKDLLQTSIDLTPQRVGNSEEELRRMQEGQPYDVFDATGKVQGQVFLAFAVSTTSGANPLSIVPDGPSLAVNPDSYNLNCNP